MISVTSGHLSYSVSLADLHYRMQAACHCGLCLLLSDFRSQAVRSGSSERRGCTFWDRIRRASVARLDKLKHVPPTPGYVVVKRLDFHLGSSLRMQQHTANRSMAAYRTESPAMETIATPVRLMFKPLNIGLPNGPRRSSGRGSLLVCPAASPEHRNHRGSGPPSTGARQQGERRR